MPGTLGSDDGGFQPITGINVTPLVDIALVLLIIFMVTATYIVALTLKVELPRARTGEETPVSTLALTIGRQGDVLLNGKAVDDGGIRSAVRQGLAAKKDVQVIISADREVRHGTVVRYIDLCKQLGVFKFAINIEEPSGP
jgi:biopolymer transport protein TolR